MPHRGQWTLEVNMSGGRKSDLSKRFRRAQGFSLIELLIVVAIILIIAAIAIPNFLRSKMSANESSAVATMRTLITSAVAYSTTYGAYPTHLTNLGPIAAGGTPSSTVADLVDSVIGTDPATKSGYTFAWTGTVSSGGGTLSFHTLLATPGGAGGSGHRGLFSD